jgi:hypothetical protein
MKEVQILVARISTVQALISATKIRTSTILDFYKILHKNLVLLCSCGTMRAVYGYCHTRHSKLVE